MGRFHPNQLSARYIRGFNQTRPLVFNNTPHRPATSVNRSTSSAENELARGDQGIRSEGARLGAIGHPQDRRPERPTCKSAPSLRCCFASRNSARPNIKLSAQTVREPLPTYT